jgi:hypothetical protein
MLWLILLTLAVLVVAGVIASRRRDPAPQAEEISAEEVMQTEVELHAIRRRFDVAWTKHELRRDTARLKRELADELDSPEQSDG